MFLINTLVILCAVLKLIVSHETRDCPNLITCTCDKSRGRARCWNVMEIPAVPPEIAILDLSDNAIIELKRFDFKHNTLTELFLGNNKLREIDRDAFGDLSELALLNLSNNQLRVLDKNIFKKNRKLKHLYLDNNPNLEFSLSELPITIEQLNVANTNIMITHGIIRNLSNLHSYDGNFCVKRNCSHSTELNVEFSRDDHKNNLMTDTQTTTEESLHASERPKIVEGIKCESNSSYTNTFVLTMGILGVIVVNIIGYGVLYMQNRNKSKINKRGASTENTLFTSSLSPLTNREDVFTSFLKLFQ